jgi:hypothetical protein
VFIDPRGGFDSDLDAPLTAEGREDDALAGALLETARKAIGASKLGAAQKAEALAGNWPGNKSYLGETVHYSYGATKARGTSFGMWASAPVTKQGAEDRPAIQTITLELPKWLTTRGRSAADVDVLAEIWADAVIEHFLEVR